MPSRLMAEDPHELSVVIHECGCARPSPFQACEFLVCPFRHFAPIWLEQNVKLQRSHKMNIKLSEPESRPVAFER